MDGSAIEIKIKTIVSDKQVFLITFFLSILNGFVKKPSLLDVCSQSVDIGSVKASGKGSQNQPFTRHVNHNCLDAHFQDANM
jgi:hypothetical protein